MSDGLPQSVCLWGQSEDKPTPAAKTSILQGTANTSRTSEPSQQVARAEPQEEHGEHIAKLAQPKKAFPGGPARLHQKKKTVAFSRTVNVSQCIEGKSLKDRKPRSEKTMLRTTNNEENKENGAPTDASKKTAVQKAAPQKPVVTEGSDNMAKIQDCLLQVMEKMDKMEKKVDGLEHAQMKVVPVSSNNFQLDARHRQELPSGPRLTENERMLLKDLDHALQINPDLRHSVADILRKTEKPNPRDDYVPDRSSSRSRTAQCPSSHNRNSVLTEQVFVQRSIQQPLSPNGAPYSTDSFNFIKRRSMARSADGNIPMSTYEAGNSVSFGTSHARSRPMGMGSTYQPGNSIGYNQPPRRNHYEDEYDVVEEEPFEDDFDADSYRNFPRTGGTRFDTSEMDLRQQERKERWKSHNR